MGSAIGFSEEGGYDTPPPVAIAGVKDGRDVRTCPACNRTFAMKPSLVGKTIRCRGCKAPFSVTATGNGRSNARLIKLAPSPPGERDKARSATQPPAPPPSHHQPISKPAAAAVAASPRPTIFEDIGDVLEDLLPGERVASVVRPRNAAARARPEAGALATLVAIVFGGVCAVPITLWLLKIIAPRELEKLSTVLPNFLTAWLR